MYKAKERQDPSLSDNRTTRFPISIKVTFAISNSPTANVTKMLLTYNRKNEKYLHVHHLLKRVECGGLIYVCRLHTNLMCKRAWDICLRRNESTCLG